MGKGSSRRVGANDLAFRTNAERSGFPPESPTLRRDTVTWNRLWKPEKPIRKSRGFIRGDSEEGYIAAFHAGKRAGLAGVDRYANPMVDSSLWRQWARGWEAGDAHRQSGQRSTDDPDVGPKASL